MSQTSTGLPQLDFSSYEPQIFWLIVFFILLYFFISKFVVPHFTQTVDGRKKRIDDLYSGAKILHKKALTLSVEYEDKLKRVYQDAELLTEEAKAENANKIQNAIAGFEKTYKTSLEQKAFVLETEIEKFKAMFDTHKQDLVTAALKKL